MILLIVRCKWIALRVPSGKACYSFSIIIFHLLLSITRYKYWNIWSRILLHRAMENFCWHLHPFHVLCHTSVQEYRNCCAGKSAKHRCQAAVLFEFQPCCSMATDWSAWHRKCWAAFIGFYLDIFLLTEIKIKETVTLKLFFFFFRESLSKWCYYQALEFF